MKASLNIHWKHWCWSWSSNNLATWCEELTHLKRPWCWERLKAGGEGDNRGQDGWMANDISLSKLGDGEGQGSLVCCSPRDCKESDMTEWLNNNSNINSWAFILVYYSHCLDVSKTSHFVYISVWGIWAYIVHAEILPCLLVYRFAYCSWFGITNASLK